MFVCPVKLGSAAWPKLLRTEEPREFEEPEELPGIKPELVDELLAKPELLEEVTPLTVPLAGVGVDTEFEKETLFDFRFVNFFDI